MKNPKKTEGRFCEGFELGLVHIRRGHSYGGYLRHEYMI